MGDGGRYATLGTLVAPGPDSDWHSWSRHRAMIYYYEYERREEPMALALGTGPAVTAAADMWIPVGRSAAVRESWPDLGFETDLGESY